MTNSKSLACDEDILNVSDLKIFEVRSSKNNLFHNSLINSQNIPTNELCNLKLRIKQTSKK